MSSTLQHTNPSPFQSTVFASLHEAQRAPVSHQARGLLTSLVLWSGKKGFCWWGIPRIARELHTSESSARRWKKELTRAGLVEELTRKGRSSYLIPFPAEFRGLLPAGMLKADGGPLPRVTLVKEKENKISNVCTLPETMNPPEPERKNVVKIRQDSKPEEPLSEQSIPEVPERIEEPEPVRATRPKPQRRPFDLGLVHELEQLTRDFHSRGAWIRVCRELDEQVIRTAMSATQCAMLETSGVRGGAYFLGTLKNLCGFSFKRFERPATVDPPRIKPDLDGALRSLELRFPDLIVREMFTAWCEKTLHEAQSIRRLRELEGLLDRHYERIVAKYPHYVRERAA